VMCSGYRLNVVSPIGVNFHGKRNKMQKNLPEITIF
jgi:hypothetical protein